MFAPLKPRGRILGLICLIRDTTSLPYSQDDLAYFIEIVTLASLAIDNAYLFRSLSREAREQDALYAANEALLSTLDLETLLGKILDAAQSAVPAAEKGMLYISLPRTGELKLRSHVGFADPRIARVFLTGRKDFVAKAARQGQPLLVRDTWDHPSLLARVNLGEKRAPRSLIVAPMVLDSKVQGVLMLSASAPDAFQQSDLDVLNRFATTATVAFQNASLHTDIQRMAITDGLTGLYNRRGFLEIGRREFDRFHRNNIPLAAILLDIDHFKAINDLHSHAVGDMVLRMVADRCLAAVRKVDIVGRFGGDEFSILLPGVEVRVAREVADRLCRLVSDHPFPTSKKPLPVTVSLGVVAARKRMKSLETMLDKADAALYLAKQRGRNTAAVGED
jgi:diguanylate cyclase (GGDEF)-like protein